MGSIRVRTLASALAFACAFLPAAPAFAGPVGVHPGLKIGIAVSNLNGNLQSLGDLQSRSQMTFGGTLRIDVGGIFTIQPELNYVPKGADVLAAITDSLNNQIGEVKASYKLNYLEFPVLAKFRFPSPGGFAPNIYIAPAAAINLVRKFEADEGAAGLPEGSMDADLNDVVEAFDFGGSVGGGFDMPTGGGVLTLDARYNMGFKEIFTTQGATDDKNRTLSVTLGYTF
jgi:hypothetical protein